MNLKDILSPGEQYLLKLLAEKDIYSYIHSIYVSKYTEMILQSMKYTEKDIIQILKGAYLHDIGKLFISNDILKKPSKLSDEEYAIMKRHVEIGLNIVKAFEPSEKTINTIKYHQERWDGKGYPSGIIGQATPIEGRIIQVTDAFSAMTVKRAYRRSFEREEALDEIYNKKGTQFDQEIVDIFIEIMKSKQNLKIKSNIYDNLSFTE